MAHLKSTVFRADREAHAIYDRLFTEYDRLHDYFGRSENPVMKALIAIRDEALAQTAVPV
jgi:L-ribulokinase